MVVKFRRYGDRPADIANFLKDRQCNCRGPFHRCRNTDILSTLKGCKCQHGRMKQMSSVCCEDPRITDVNVLIDASFESSTVDTPVPAHFTAPVGAGWGQNTVYSETPYFATQYWIRDLDPDTGTKHAWQHFAAGPGGNGGQWIEPIRKRDCTYNLGYSAIVQTGDLVTWTIRAKVSQLTGDPQSLMMINFHTPTWASIFPTPGTVFTPLTTSYATYTAAAIAPANSHFCRVFYQPESQDSHSDTEWFMDNCSLVVS